MKGLVLRIVGIIATAVVAAGLVLLFFGVWIVKHIVH